MKLAGNNEISSLEFDIPRRQLHVYHSESSEKILDLLDELMLNSSIISSQTVDYHKKKDIDSHERKTLWAVLIINFSFFIIEMTAGWISGSMGLVADSLDMLADSIVYGLALVAVGGTIARKKNIARIAGIFQIILALAGFAEIIRRFAGFEKMPDFRTMIIVSVLALIANIICLYLLQKSKSREAHMQASMIFTSNDIIINAGVITAGLLVYWLESGYPDLIIGAVVLAVVLRGAYRILQLSK